MPTVVLLTPPDAIPPDAMARAGAVLRAGGLVAFPTETVYGLGANALDAAAVARIYAAKGRPASNPVIVHVADAAAARALTADWPDEARLLAERFWPGPLTLVLRRGTAIPDAVTAGGPTVAVRVPAHAVALALIRAADRPLAAPSANRSNRLSPTRAAHVLNDLDGRMDLLLDGGPTAGGIESTVLDLSCLPARLLRPGLIAPGRIEEVIGSVEREIREAGGPLPSPGMLARHYAPRTPLEGVEGSGRERVKRLAEEGLRVGWLKAPGGEGLGRPGVIEVEMPGDPAGYAAALYDGLHRLDGLGLDRVVVEWPPEGETWLGVRDRLRRAMG